MTTDATPVNGDKAQEVIDVLKDQIAREYSPPTLKRDAHPKMHGCVQAELVVEGDVPKELRRGVFAEPAKYCAWVRFSNAFRIQHDLELETRGMAIKLLGVPGKKLLPDEEFTQDFLRPRRTPSSCRRPTGTSSSYARSPRTRPRRSGSS